MRLAGLDVDQAQLVAAATKIPPAPGLVWDDEGNQWVNSSDLAAIKKQRARAEENSNEWAGFSISELMALLNGDKLDANTFRSILSDPNGKYGYMDSTVDHLLDLADVMKAKGSQPVDTTAFDVSNIPPPPSGSGEQTGPTTAAGTPLPGGTAQFFGNAFRR